MSGPIKVNYTIDQNSEFDLQLNLSDENGDPVFLAGYIATAALKKWYTSRVSYPLTTAVNAAASYVTLSLTPAQTLLIPAGRYVHDVYIVGPNGTPTVRIVEGLATVTPAVAANGA